jgi:predicted MFS family arabinose efflux permease
MLGVAGALYCISYFHRIAPSVMATDLMAAFAITAAALGTLTAIYPYVFAVMGVPAGTLADTLGPRRTLALGATTMAVGATVFALAPRFAIAYGGRLLVGLGASVILISGLRLAAAWFSGDEFALASGIVMTLGNIGGLAAALPLAVSVERIGWRASLLVIAAGTLLLGVLAAVALRDAPRPRPPRTAGEGPPSLAAALRAVPLIAANWPTWPPVLATAGVNATFVTLAGLWGVPYLIDVHGFTRVDASTCLSFGALGLVVGAPLMGRLSDRWLGRRRMPFVASGLLYAVLWAALVALSRPGAPAWALTAIFFGLGVASCGAFVLLWSCVREVNHPGRVGVALGFANTPIFAIFALVQWLSGAMLDARWAGAMAAGRRVYPAAAYRETFAVFAALAVVSFALACLVRETYCQNVWAEPARR